MNPTLDTTVLSAPTVPVVAPRAATPAAAQPVVPRPARVEPATVEPAPPRDCVEIWDVPFDRLDMSQSVSAIGNLIERGRIAGNQPAYVITANLNYCMLHHNDAGVRQITADADLILADGQPIVWRSQLQPNPLPVRVAGSEMILHLCKNAAEKGHRVYFLGGADGVAEACAARLVEVFPELQVAGTDCPPFRQLTPNEHAACLRRIRKAKTDLLFVAFGQPKGERWIHENYRELGVPVSIQLGASFDFIAGTAIRAPKIYQRLGAEWVYRMLSDPKRLMPRYGANAWFLIKALARDWRRQVTRWGMWE